MPRRACVVALILFTLSFAGAQASIHEFYVDALVGGALPVSWASESPTLSHLGFDALAAFEYDAPFGVPLRIELGYLGVSASRISSSGELYRAWQGGRVALLSGYIIDQFSLGQLGQARISLLAGGALTAADYTDTALAFAYPSIVLEPRIALILRGARAKGIVTGPSLSLPIELMFRAGTYSLAPGLSLGWRYRLGAIL
jgi:hypothetical protein